MYGTYSLILWDGVVKFCQIIHGGGIAPETFQIVAFPHFGGHQMDQNAAEIDQIPAPGADTVVAGGVKFVFVADPAFQLRAEGMKLRLGVRRSDNNEIRNT